MMMAMPVKSPREPPRAEMSPLVWNERLITYLGTVGLDQVSPFSLKDRKQLFHKVVQKPVKCAVLSMLHANAKNVGKMRFIQ